MYGYMEMTMFHGFFMLLFWGAIFYLIFSFSNKDTSSNEALSILKKRFANGDISKREYDNLKAII